MKRLAVSVLTAACLAAVAAPPAGAAFGFRFLDIAFTDRLGFPATEAGSHPHEFTTTIEVNSTTTPELGEVPDDSFRDLRIELPPGLVGDPGATPRCDAAEFATVDGDGRTACPDASAVGIAVSRIGLEGPGSANVPVFNLHPPPGVAAKFGFVVLKVPIAIEVNAKPVPPYNLVAEVSNIPQAVLFYGSQVTLWGNPFEDVHDPLRGRCLELENNAEGEVASNGECGVSIPERPFLTLPRSCQGPLSVLFEGRSWQNPGAWVRGEASTHDNAEPPGPLGITNCASLGFGPRIQSKPTTDHAESPTGLTFNLDIEDEGLTDPNGRADSDIKKAVVMLPVGVTANPSVAEGLGTCSLADYEAESISSAPGEGCPEASKIGRVEVETPLLEGELLRGDVFVAEQDDPSRPGAENPFDTLLALYMVVKHPPRGILVKLAGKVEPHPTTGQLVTTFGEPGHEIPQFPFSHFRFFFREGGRSPLITPPHCDTYETKAIFTPWANPSTSLPTTATFQITRGVSGGPCPPAGTPPFMPGFEAGSNNNNAGAYTPFYMRLTRRDGDQDLTKFSSELPPGLLGKLAGVAKCPQGSIDRAESKTGRQELATPSCPAESQLGRTVAGAGVGSQLTYVPGKIYLAGPYKGAPLSVAAITPAVAGPFDAGTVVVQVGLDVDPVTGQARTDGSASDPIPHFLKGIPLKVRDLRVYIDRDEFVLNPTGCEPAQVKAQLWGGGLELFSVADDAPVVRATRFQAANCANLGFKPRLTLSLKGGTKRGDNPALTAVLRPRPGDSNLAKAVVRFPRSTFLDQDHIRTICTRVQFAKDSCPPGAIYGGVRAFTPLLDEPLEGPVYLRSSDNPLPDIVFDLRGLVDIEAAARADSIKGQLRVTFPAIPDAPVSKVIVNMQGGRKGLLVNSRGICAPRPRARAQLEGHNGKRRKLRPVMRPKGCKASKRQARR
jgi:hypothetical protein